MVTGMCLFRRQRVRVQPLHLRQHLYRRDRQVPLHLSSWPYRGPLPSRSVGSRYADSIGSKVLARLPLPSRSVGSRYADSIGSKVLARLPLPSRSVGSRYADSIGSKVFARLPLPDTVTGVTLCRFNRVKGTSPAPAARHCQWGHAMQIQ